VTSPPPPWLVRVRAPGKPRPRPPANAAPPGEAPAPGRRRPSRRKAAGERPPPSGRERPVAERKPTPRVTHPLAARADRHAVSGEPAHPERPRPAPTPFPRKPATPPAPYPASATPPPSGPSRFSGKSCQPDRHAVVAPRRQGTPPRRASAQAATPEARARAAAELAPAFFAATSVSSSPCENLSERSWTPTFEKRETRPFYGPIFA